MENNKSSRYDTLGNALNVEKGSVNEINELVDERQLAIMVNLQLLEKQKLSISNWKLLIQYGQIVLNHMLHGY